MNPWFKRTALAAGVLVAVAAGAVGAAVIYSDMKMHRVINIKPHSIALQNDADSIEHGRYLYQTKGCADCHGNDGGGRVFVDDEAAGLKMAGANISAAAHSPVSQYDATDWDSSIRHGVKPNGEPLVFMPAEDYARLSDGDLQDLVAYVRQLPAVEGLNIERQIPLPVRVLYGVGVIQDAAEKIDHNLPVQTAIAPSISVEYGEYLVQTCKGCHGQQLTGGAIPGAPPAWPPAANLTQGEHSAMSRYRDLAAFRDMFRTGKRPDGSVVSNVMPFAALSQVNDVDVEAMYLYLTAGSPAML